ncbi:MAG: aminotransferase class III-fold pyridoxal phosphate-dependent enzyme [Ilumatobacteraceae bacterium]
MKADDPIERRYVERTPGSAAVGARAEQVMPAGDTRAAGYHSPYPLTLVRGAGAEVWDVDGNGYWDLAGNYTALVHGHACAPIVEAAVAAIGRGTAWPARNPGQVELAELLVDRIASVERVRFCNSGTEAGMLASVVARVATGRPNILMARFGYHGSHELFEHGSFDGRLAVPGATATLLAEYGDAASFEAVLAERGDEIAAVFLEPVMGSGGVVTAPPEFFQRVERAARAVGALFVLDEVITIRLGVGGAQAALGVRPDLTMMGKLIGGGFPVGALGGREDLMAWLDPRRNRIFHSGTFNGNPVTMAAGAASVRHLTAERIDAIDRLGARLEQRLCEAASAVAVPFSVRRVGSLLNVYFLDTPPGANLLRQDHRAMRRFHLAGMNHGLYFASRGMLVVSTAMDDAAIDDIGERAGAAMADVVAAGEGEQALVAGS